MTFANENTWPKFQQAGRADEFHKKYDEAAARARGQLGRKYPLVIGGEDRHSREGEFTSTSPADTRIVLGYFQLGTIQDVRDAIATAKKGFETWQHEDWTQRVSIFRKAGDLLSQRKFDFAAILSMENGKNRFESIGDVDEGIDMLRFYGEQLELNKGFTREMNRAFPNERAVSVLRPYGVWGIIAPFNFIALSIGMCTGVVLTANTGVFKPSSDIPLTSFKFFKLLNEAGVPDGVLNYVSGSGESIGLELAQNPEVSGVVFTGSSEVGMKILSIGRTQRYPKPFIAEMGGKNPAIVTGKADLDLAVEGVLRSAFGYGGQKCSACSRVYVEKNVYQPFIEKLVQSTKAIKIGDPLRAEVFLGPLINRRAVKKYQDYVEIAKKSGKLIAGGNSVKSGDYAHGYFVEPTIVEGLPKEHRLFKEEMFVPILCTTPVESLDEALKLANDVDYGLTAGIFSKDETEIRTFFDKIQAGVTYANRSIGATTGAMCGVQAFGGWKMSGSTGKGTSSVYYLQQFLREQSQSTYT